MSKFTRYNNPKKRRRHKKLSYSERCVMVGKEMLLDKNLGYDVPVSYYNEKAER